MSYVDQMSTETICRQTFVDSTAPQVAAYFRRKGWLDRALAGVLLIPGLPLIGLLVVLVRLTSRGPGIFAQVRVGLNGRLFTMYKLRTMRVDAEAGTGAVWCKTNDPRITPVGNWLRRLHLDELPQLFNVLWGEMSLVGPRPERPEIVPTLADCIPSYLRRLEVSPGVTGLAQVNLPPDTDLNSVRRKLLLDLEYVRTGSLLLDARLVACTLLRIVGLRYGRAVRLLGLERTVVLPDEHERHELNSRRDPVAARKPAEKAPPAPHRQRDTDIMNDTLRMSQFEETLGDGADEEEELNPTAGALARRPH